MSQSDENTFIDGIGLYNKYYLGDSVLLEPIANALHEIFATNISIISNYSELFDNHPTIKGYSFDNIPPNIRLIDMSKSIRSIIKKDINIKGKPVDIILSNKYDNMFDEAGVPLSYQVPPKLYLSPKEDELSNTLKSLFPNPCIGICLNSRHDIKNYIYSKLLINQLTKRGYNIFIFDMQDQKINGINIYKVINKPLREVMVYLNFMDIVIGCDTGIMHMAGALSKQIIVILYKEFYNLYQFYPKCIPLLSSYSIFGLRTISVKQVMNTVDLVLKKTTNLSYKKSDDSNNIAIVRFRGIGDIILTLPIIATLKAKYSQSKITYITSKGMAEILQLAPFIDDVKGLDYDHGYDPEEPLPQNIDLEKYDIVYNLINRVDFLKESQRISRIDLFANLLNIEKIDYNLDWSIKIPEDWKQDVRKILDKEGVLETDKIIVLQTNSKGLSRRWPRERQEEFIDLATDFKVVLINDVIEEGYKDAINLTGRLNLKQYFALLDICDIIISPDSGSVHIGGWLNKLTIALFGSVDPRLRIQHYDSVYPIIGKAKCVPCNDWMNKQCNNAIKPLECMYSITAQSVLDLIKKII